EGRIGRGAVERAQLGAVPGEEAAGRPRRGGLRELREEVGGERGIVVEGAHQRAVAHLEAGEGRKRGEEQALAARGGGLERAELVREPRGQARGALEVGAREMAGPAPRVLAHREGA